jgi:hypothetical protein
VVHDLVELAPPTRRRAIDEQTISETDNGEEESESRSQDAIICQQMPKPDPVIAAVADALPKSEPPAIAATVVDDEIIVPSKTVQDEIRYVINSLCKTNLETKVRIHTNTYEYIDYANAIDIFILIFFLLIFSINSYYDQTLHAALVKQSCQQLILLTFCVL